MTPQLGKRKRGSKDAQASEDDGQLDELSPDRPEEVHSIEKSRRVPGMVSPIREEVDDIPDELSILEEGTMSIRKPGPNPSVVAGGTPASVSEKPRDSSGSAREKTPIASRISSMSISSHTAMVRRSKSTEPPPITPAILPNGRPRLSSASHFGPEFTTPSAVQDGDDGGDSEDELSPPQLSGATPRVIAKAKPTQRSVQDDSMELDELSSPPQPTSTLQTPQPGPPKQAKQQQEPSEAQRDKQQAAPPPAKRGRPRRVVMDEEDEVQATPAASKQKKTSLDVQEEGDAYDTADEISPEATRTKPSLTKAVRRGKEIADISSAEESDNYSPELEEEPAEPAPRPALKPKPAKASSDKPPLKRPRYTGPKQAISVMRIKGSTVRGVTVADTTRTILEQNIDYQINRMVEKMQKAQDPARRREIRGEVNLTLAFKESLNEKLLDLQDANDTLSSGFKKRKLLKNGNIERRKEILSIQNSRQEIALEMDDEQAKYDAERQKVEARNKLSANIFEIQAAIQNGRERAKREGREDEGPDVPLSILLETVGRDVGSFGGGLLSGAKAFNSALERAAGWLEGRA